MGTTCSCVVTMHDVRKLMNKCGNYISTCVGRNNIQIHLWKLYSIHSHVWELRLYMWEGVTCVGTKFTCVGTLFACVGTKNTCVGTKLACVGTTVHAIV